MKRISIERVATAHPPLRLSQQEAAERIGRVTGQPRRAAALARGTQIRERAVCLTPDEIAGLGSVQQRNEVYAQHAPGLALEAARAALDGGATPEALIAMSCTGYMVPGWDVTLVRELPLACDAVRLPITQAGCSGGVLGMARAADFVRHRPGSAALVVACEVCSLAFQASSEEGNLTSTLIFADGAGAALVTEAGGSDGLEVADSLSFLHPAPASTLGFELTDNGFYPLLGRDLPGVVAPAAGRAIALLLGRNNLRPADIAFWLLHPGGARILSGLEEALCLDRGQTRWSWESMAEFGNTSSAAVFDVMRRYLADAAAPGGWGVVAAFGPGVSVELLLVRR